MGKQAKRSALKVGALAEAMVAQWLVGQGWEILQRRWYCRWGELDLVAYSASLAATPQSDRAPLVFVEVKARQRGNWDAGGLLAVTPQKQAKLWQAAQLFLAEQPHLSQLPCCFAIALITYQPLQPTGIADDRLGELPAAIELGQPVTLGNYRLTLQEYLPVAFDVHL